MFEIGDVVLAKMYREKLRIVLIMSAVLVVLGGIVDVGWIWLFTEVIYATPLMIVCVIITWITLMGLKYRMHKGEYPSTTQERNDLDRWLEKHGGVQTSLPFIG
jgi:Na+(H+)/acetate symporter ActP